MPSLPRFTGGDKFDATLKRLGSRMTAGKLRVGFLEGATYPARPGAKSLPVAQVAFWNNFGTATIPARPFFSNMIRDESGMWGQILGNIAKANNYDSKKTLGLMGVVIGDQLVKAIVDWPADNAPSTVARKGFNKGLIDKGVMQRSVGAEVTK